MGHDMHYKLEDDHFVYIESFSAYNNTAYNFTLEDLSGGELKSKITAESAQYDNVSSFEHSLPVAFIKKDRARCGR